VPRTVLQALAWLTPSSATSEQTLEQTEHPFRSKFAHVTNVANSEELIAVILQAGIGSRCRGGLRENSESWQWLRSDWWSSSVFPGPCYSEKGIYSLV
jgi:hypothetical protein